MVSTCVALQKPSLQRTISSKAFNANRAAPRTAVRVMAQKQEKVSKIKSMNEYDLQTDSTCCSS